MKRAFINIAASLMFLFLICSRVSAVNSTPLTVTTPSQEFFTPRTYDTVEQYLDYIATFTDRSEFLTYEIIAELGYLRFYSFTHFPSAGEESGTPDGTCTDYAYDLITASNQILTFHVYPGKPTPPSDAVISSEFSNARDLRTNAGLTGWCAIKDIFYYYDNGVLKTIQLPVGNNTIQLTMPDGFGNYPLNPDPALVSFDIICYFLDDHFALLGRYTFNDYLPTATIRAPGFDNWKAQHKIVQSRYELFSSKNRNLAKTLTPFQERLYHYVKNPEWFGELNTDLYLEDFLSFEVGTTTVEEVYQRVGAPHMTSGSGTVGEVYLTSDGYCIVFRYVPRSKPMVDAWIQHVDWQESRDFDAFRQELLQQPTAQEQEEKPSQNILWYISLGVVVTCAAVAIAIFLKRKNKK